MPAHGSPFNQTFCSTTIFLCQKNPDLKSPYFSKFEGQIQNSIIPANLCKQTGSLSIKELQNPNAETILLFVFWRSPSSPCEFTIWSVLWWMIYGSGSCNKLGSPDYVGLYLSVFKKLLVLIYFCILHLGKLNTEITTPFLAYSRCSRNTATPYHGNLSKMLL